MTTTFATHLYKAIHEGKINANFKGIALGDSWISPVDSVASWADYLYTLVCFK
jgi:serine carboxypeptidase 1